MVISKKSKPLSQSKVKCLSKESANSHIMDSYLIQAIFFGQTKIGNGLSLLCE